MTEPVLVFDQDLVVALDYGQFTLETGETDPDLAVTLLDQALGADGIAQSGELLVVVSPHQNNFEMPLRVEVWSDEPGDDLDEWEEAFAASIDVGPDGVTYGSPTMDYVAIPVPPGRYRALISGRGFVAQGWPGSTTPGDRWRITLWPSIEPTAPSRLRKYTEPEIS